MQRVKTLMLHCHNDRFINVRRVRSPDGALMQVAMTRSVGICIISAKVSKRKEKDRVAHGD